MNHRAEPADSGDWMALRVRAAISGYVVLLIITWLTGSDVLAAICLVLLTSAILLPGLQARRLGAWLIWIAVIAVIGVLTAKGQVHILLDFVPIAVNLGLAFLFAHSLRAPHTPMIARAVIAIEGKDRLALPGVADYARRLTLAWVIVFCVQFVLFIALVYWWLPAMPPESDARALAVSWLHVGGYVLPMVFMAAEYLFRRWHFRNLPHSPPRQFFRQLIRNWPLLLRDAALPRERMP